MVITANPPKFDKRQPSKGDYDAIVYIDGSQVIAEDSNGRKIASGVAGTDDATVIQAAENSLILGGSLFLQPSGQKYVISTPISISPGINLLGIDTEIDVTTLNDVVFDFVAGTSNPLRKSSISGIHAFGVEENTSTLFCRVTDNHKKFSAENLYMNDIANGVHIFGNCFLPRLSNIRIMASKYGGIPIKFDTSIAYPTSYPAAATLSHVWIETPDVAPGPDYLLYNAGAIGVSWFGGSTEGTCAAGIYTGSGAETLLQGVILSHSSNDYTSGKYYITNCGRIRMHGITVNGGTLKINNIGYIFPGSSTFISISGNCDSIDIGNCYYEGVTNKWMVFVSGSTTVGALRIRDVICTGYNNTQQGLFVNIPSSSIATRLNIHDNDIYNMGYNASTNFQYFKSTNGAVHHNKYVNILSKIFLASYGNNVITDNVLSGVVGTYLINAVDVINRNSGYITPGESRSVSGLLTAGNADAIAFAWHNPELQDILIKKVTIRITTPGGTAGSLLDVGIADDATGTNLGTEFFNDLDLNTAGTSDQDITPVFCQDSVSATDGWVVGKILVQNAASLVGSYYIEYMGA